MGMSRKDVLTVTDVWYTEMVTVTKASGIMVVWRMLLEECCAVSDQRQALEWLRESAPGLWTQ